MGFLQRNLSLKLLAILLAIFLWIYVKYTQSPLTQERTLSRVLVPFQVKNLAGDMAVFDAPEKIAVVVEGSQDIIEQSLKEDFFDAYIDAKDLIVSSYYLPVQLKAPPGITVKETVPSHVTVRLESLENKQVIPKIQIQGKPASGFVAGAPQLSQPQLIVKAPRTLLGKLKEVLIVADINGANVDIFQKVTPVPVDVQDKVLKNVSIEPSQVRVTVPIKSEVTTQILPISPQITGFLDKPYSIQAVKVEPATATILVPMHHEKLPDELKTEPILLKSFAKEITREVNVMAPPGISIISGKTVKVTLKIKRR